MKRQIIQGTIQGNERGYGFLIPNDPLIEDFFIPHGDLKGAMHKDVVLAEATYGKGERTTARVLKILERGVSEVVGTYFSSKRGGFVTPDDRKYFCDIFVPFGKGLRAKSGDKVVCKIIAYPHKQNPEGIIKEVLGRQFNHKTELKSILRTYGLEDGFHKKVIKACDFIEQPIQEDFDGRKDFTNLVTMTIDGDDSRDFDDAVSIEKNEDGSYLLGVHIADVSHYVKGGSEIDLEALKRGTSVYFPESVIPMLPEKLCNDVCSLKEGVERLTLSCMILLDDKGVVKQSKIYKSYIKSRARLTYSNVQKLLDGQTNLPQKYFDLKNEIFLMNELTDLLVSRRNERGYINLEVNESAIFVDQRNKINVSITPRDRAHRIIEEFMVLANVCVAKLMNKNQVPCIYRIHDRPDEEKYKFFLAFLSGVGINAPYKEELATKDYQSILESAEDNPAYSVINRVMLRSMQKAKYSAECMGHFGLGESDYCHFTSPIRRYPDLFVHRALKDYLDEGEQFVYKKYGYATEGVAKRASETERNAMEAERAVDDYYKTLYISEHVGESFGGVISGVTNFGVFVELENGIEGIVKIETIEGKRFKYDDKNFVLSDGNKKYKLGQSVRIIVAGVNLGERRAEFVFVK